MGTPPKFYNGIKSRILATLDGGTVGYRVLQPSFTENAWVDIDGVGAQNVVLAGLRKTKTSDTSRASVTAVAADPDLSLSLAAGRWRVRGSLWITCANTTPGFKMDLGSTWNTAFGLVAINSNNGAVVQAAGSNLALTGTAINSPGGLVTFDGILVPTATSAFEVRWAQNASNVNAVLLKAGSYIEAIRLP